MLNIEQIYRTMVKARRYIKSKAGELGRVGGQAARKVSPDRLIDSNNAYRMNEAQLLPDRLAFWQGTDHGTKSGFSYYVAKMDEGELRIAGREMERGWDYFGKLQGSTDLTYQGKLKSTRLASGVNIDTFEVKGWDYCGDNLYTSNDKVNIAYKNNKPMGATVETCYDGGHAKGFYDPKGNLLKVVYYRPNGTRELVKYRNGGSCLRFDEHGLPKQDIVPSVYEDMLD